MLLLSSLIGPAKPPVATREDVEKAGGVFTLAENMEDERRSSILGERCLICLSDFEVGEECRQITTCTHIYHKDCIDEVCSALFEIWQIICTNVFVVAHYREKHLPALPRRRRGAQAGR